jgi:dethiobiotin synthetase
VSPDAASHSAGVEIDLDLITSKLPTENRPLIIEGAGGLLVPLNSRKLIIDLVEALDSSIILVSRNYLGSINHTLLSIEAIKARGLSFAGIIFVGDENTESQGSIESFSKERVLGRVPWFSEFSLKELKTVGADISYPEG